MASSTIPSYRFTTFRSTSNYKPEVEAAFNGRMVTHYGPQETALERVYAATDRKCELLFRDNILKGFIVYKTELQNRLVTEGVNRSVEIKNIYLLNPSDPDALIYQRLMLHRIQSQTASLNPEGIFMLASEQDRSMQAFLSSHEFRQVASWNDTFIEGQRANLFFKKLPEEKVAQTNFEKRPLESSSTGREEFSHSKRGRTSAGSADGGGDYGRYDSTDYQRGGGQRNLYVTPSQGPIRRENFQQKPKTHSIPLKKQYLDQIRSGRKTVEGRIDSGMMKGVKVGDTVCFFAGENKICCRIREVSRYNSFSAMLAAEGVSNCLADVTDLNAGIKVYHSIPSYEDRAARSGVLAWKLEVIR